MANPSTTASPSATASEAAHASRRYIERVAEVNRDLVDLWSTWLDTSAQFSKDVLCAWTELARSTQSTALKAYKTSATLLDAE